ncbi:alanyl-tRNA editing protein [Halobacteriales archaeon QS_3_64_16]|nr:MAG: alanyl-tRNA editing protein [Halobacteriales archaeon QS_3_64_16]
MTDPVYRMNTYDRRFETTVTHTLDDRVTLDQTLFYPEGGGQPADRGTITDGQREWRVRDVQKTDTIYHHLTPIGEDNGEEKSEGTDGTEASGREESSGSIPESGATVRGEIDWERRYGHMRHHTAQHLLSGLLLEEYDAATTGNQLYADRARIDVGYDRFEEDDLEAIETRMNDLVSEARPVESYELDRETAEAELDPERTRIELLPDSITEIRIVEIEGYDRTACAGTHIAGTEEIGTVSVTGRESRGSGEERLRFALGS